jgi:hypothetical protein
MASKLKPTGVVEEVWFVIKQDLQGVDSYHSAYRSRERASKMLDQILARIVVSGYTKDGTFNAYASLLPGRLVKTKSGQELIMREGKKPITLFWGGIMRGTADLIFGMLVGVIVGGGLTFLFVAGAEVENKYIGQKIVKNQGYCQEHQGVKSFQIWGRAIVCEDGTQITSAK